MTPQAFRTGGDGEVIRSAVGASSLGPVLVAVADKGVCAVLLDGDAGRTLLPRLVEMFPRAEHRADPRALGGLVSRALTRADVPEPGRELLPRPVRRVCLRERIRQELRAPAVLAGHGAGRSTPSVGLRHVG